MTLQLISVALPVRNGANFLAEALDSILAQTWSDFTLHVSDNASDDATPDILADYAARDARVQVSRCAELIPQAANVNRAVRLGGSRWVKLFCHDDVMRVDCLDALVQAICAVEGTSVALLGSGERHLFSNGFLTEERPDQALAIAPGRRQLRRRFSGDPAALPMPSLTTATVRRDAFAAQGGFDQKYVHFDVFCWYEMLTKWDYAFLPAQLTINRIHGGQVAVAARASLRSVHDHRNFLDDFIRRNGAEIGLNTAGRLRTKLIAPGLAAGALVVAMRSRQWKQVAQMLGRIPPSWLPLMPALVARTWRHEARRLAKFHGKVPSELLYGA